jgi:hypothetical protein
MAGIYAEPAAGPPGEPGGPPPGEPGGPPPGVSEPTSAPPANFNPGRDTLAAPAFESEFANLDGAHRAGLRPPGGRRRRGSTERPPPEPTLAASRSHLVRTQSAVAPTDLRRCCLQRHSQGTQLVG